MKITELKTIEQETVIDIICDCCGKSCNTEYGFESMKLEAHWGYLSNKDLESWEAYICESCVDGKLSFIKFKKTNPVTGTTYE